MTFLKRTVRVVQQRIPARPDRDGDGGRIAEDVFIGSITTGAANDIEKATEIARAMVCEYGMSELGPSDLWQKGKNIPWPRDREHRDYAKDTAIKIDQEVKKIIGGKYERAKKILEDTTGML